MPKVTGRGAVVGRLKSISKETIQEVSKALYAGGQIIEAEAKHLITQGAISGKGHVASKPYEPPNEDTGILRSHIETTQPAPLRVTVSSNAPYAVPLEKGSKRVKGKVHATSFGTGRAKGGETKFGPIRVEVGDSETLPRPYMAPASRGKRLEVIKLIKEAVDRAVAKS